MAGLKLNRIPSELTTYILKVQKSEKEKKGVKQYSQELAVIKIIREHKELREGLS